MSHVILWLLLIWWFFLGYIFCGLFSDGWRPWRRFIPEAGESSHHAVTVTGPGLLVAHGDGKVEWHPGVGAVWGIRAGDAISTPVGDLIVTETDWDAEHPDRITLTFAPRKAS